MRKIQFKGKTKVIAGDTYNMGKSDGEWVKGYLYNDVGCWRIKQFETHHADYIGYEVDPETVSEYIGKTDKNGKDIFEGDILHFVNDYNGAFWKEWNCIVEFVDGAFVCQYPHQDTYVNFNGWAETVSYEVIGNVYDNADLLKGEGENA